VQTVGVSDVNAGSGGPNSMLAQMIADYRATDPLADVWALPLSDDAAATASVDTLTFTGPATAAGALAIMIAGYEIQVPVNVGDTAQTISNNVNAAINSSPPIPGTATVAGSAPYAVTLTSDNKGAAAGDIPVVISYYGAAGGETIPAGVGVTIATPTIGATNPSTGLATALANLAAKNFDFIVCPYTDMASLNSISSLLNLTTGRWSWSQQIYGGAFTAFRGTVGQRGTFAATRGGDNFITCLGFNGAPAPAYRWAANYAGACAASLRANPAVPLGGAGDGVDLTMLAPPIASQDVFGSDQTLLTEGVSTYTVSAGTVRVQRAVNLYTTNTAGQPDASFRDVETNYTLMAVVRDLLSSLSAQFGRKILVADGTPIPGGSLAVTSQTILQAIISRYNYLASLFLVQKPQAFAAAAAATNVGNGVVTLYLPINVANQLRVVAGNVSFSKS
jgi:phage tail sheath gpL-like